MAFPTLANYLFFRWLNPSQTRRPKGGMALFANRQTGYLNVLYADGTTKDLASPTPGPIDYVSFANQTDAPTWSPGRTFYRDNSLNVMTDFSDVTIQVGEESQIPVVNKEGSKVLNGSPLYISGAQGNRLAVKIPTSTDLTTQSVVGLATHDIEDNQNGRATTFGLARDINTTAFSVGDTLFVDGATLTNVPPLAAGTYLAFVGWCVVSHPVQGQIFVNPYVQPAIAGTTAQRPAVARVGTTWFDTTLGKLIVWTGAAWVNADGTSL